ncbi:RNA-directed DNA polymerase, eukaryota, reverse transcriptase zinc-binding domain protein [Tanacetum coccineum]
MGSFRSKEDDVAKISTSIFVSNFPDSVSAKDLFHSCKQYGHVVDSFIPMKRLKDGKRFGFVRFINVFNVERLVNNLCTFDSRNSFVNVLKGTNMVKETDSSPVIVLEEDCLGIPRIYLIPLIGKVHWIRAKEATGWIPEFSESQKVDDDHLTGIHQHVKQSDLGLLIDGEGNGSDEIVNNRLEILGKLQQVNKAQALEVAQKAKIKWRTNYLFTCGEIPKGCNSTFIALILKNLDANMVKDFCPISLIGSIYKIIAKILTNRLVGVLGDIVNEVQSAFISERQILDGPFILNEIMQWCRRRKKQSLIFKVDFEKAYDSVRWDFLDDILVKFGFGIKWRGWIQNCLNSSKGSILVNGSPTEEFQFYKGLKQGDPYPPFLFILVSESLLIVSRCGGRGHVMLVLSLAHRLIFHHLLYGNDCIISWAME